MLFTVTGTACPVASLPSPGDSTSGLTPRLPAGASMDLCVPRLQLLTWGDEAPRRRSLSALTAPLACGGAGGFPASLVAHGRAGALLPTRDPDLAFVSTTGVSPGSGRFARGPQGDGVARVRLLEVLGLHYLPDSGGHVGNSGPGGFWLARRCLSDLKGRFLQRCSPPRARVCASVHTCAHA